MKKLIPVLLLASLISITMSLWADTEVELNPGFVEGQIQFEGVAFEQISVYAVSGEYNANWSEYGTNLSQYNLTVQVPAGTEPEYQVRAQGRVSWGERYYVNFPNQSIKVSEGLPAKQLDFIQQSASLLNGRVILPPGSIEVVQEVRLVAQNITGELAGANTQRHLSGDEFSMRVFPGQDITLTATVVLVGGFEIDAVYKNLAVDAGGTVTQDIVIESIDGGYFNLDIDLQGESLVNSYDCLLFGKIQTYFGGTPESDNLLDYQSGLLPVGSYGNRCTAYLNEYDDHFKFPSQYFSISADQSTPLSHSAKQAFINTGVDFSGVITNADIALNEFYKFSIFQSRTGGYTSQDRHSHTGDIDMVVSEGDWWMSSIHIPVRQTANTPPFLSRQITFLNFHFDADRMVSVLAGETAETPRIDMPMGSVTVNFRRSDGGVLSNPYLRASGRVCEDEAYYYSFSSYAGTGIYRQIDVTEGKATFIGPKARCTGVEAWAQVNGANVEFGRVNVDIVGGAEREVDIDGPSLSLDIEPNSEVSGDWLTVTGLASDDTEVQSVTVNGLEASLVASANPDDPNEVLFSVDVPIGTGVNVLETIATDVTDKTNKDKRSVFNDQSAPVISFTPVDGSQHDIALGGLVINASLQDDVDISSARLNGNDIPLVDEGEGKYTFAYVMPLIECSVYPCEMPLTVSATDPVGKVSSKTHVIKLVTQVVASRLCDANQDEVVDMLDIRDILANRNVAVAADDPRDYDANGVLNVLDARGCQRECDLARCASPE